MLLKTVWCIAFVIVLATVVNAEDERTTRRRNRKNKRRRLKEFRVKGITTLKVSARKQNKFQNFIKDAHQKRCLKILRKYITCVNISFCSNEKGTDGEKGEAGGRGPPGLDGRMVK